MSDTIVYPVYCADYSSTRDRKLMLQTLIIVQNSSKVTAGSVTVKGASTTFVLMVYNITVINTNHPYATKPSIHHHSSGHPRHEQCLGCLPQAIHHDSGGPPPHEEYLSDFLMQFPHFPPPTYLHSQLTTNPQVHPPLHCSSS
jgi:hypothetical protein